MMNKCNMVVEMDDEECQNVFVAYAASAFTCQQVTRSESLGYGAIVTCATPAPHIGSGMTLLNTSQSHVLATWRLHVIL